MLFVEGISRTLFMWRYLAKTCWISQIDLPGLIQTTEKINQQMIDDVNEIVQRYMAKTRTVYAIVPCNQDIATRSAQISWRPYGDRTLGVLTNFSRFIDEGGEQRIVNILKNKNDL